MWTGQVGRRAVATTFDVSIGHVTQDLQRYREMAPSNLLYDVGRKCFRQTDAFRPVFDSDEPAEILRVIAATVSLCAQDRTRLLGFDIPVGTAQPLPAVVDQHVLMSVCRAITGSELLEISYQSMNTPEPVARQFAPRALVFTGQRWLVRGWDNRHQDYRDLALSRIIDAEPLDATGALPRDNLWHDEITLEIGLAEGLSKSQAEVTAREFGMKDEGGAYCVRIAARKAMVPYVLDNLQTGSNTKTVGRLPLRVLNYDIVKAFDRPDADRRT